MNFKLIFSFNFLTSFWLRCCCLTFPISIWNTSWPRNIYYVNLLSYIIYSQGQHSFRKLATSIRKIKLILYIYRAIFRWLTVKDLNKIKFDETLDPDSPMALLSQIKQGAESYHNLFKRLCRYVTLTIRQTYIHDRRFCSTKNY